MKSVENLLIITIIVFLLKLVQSNLIGLAKNSRKRGFEILDVSEVKVRDFSLQLVERFKGPDKMVLNSKSSR